jgi:hypothetical protein
MRQSVDHLQRRDADAHTLQTRIDSVGYLNADVSRGWGFLSVYYLLTVSQVARWFEPVADYRCFNIPNDYTGKHL